MIKYFILKYFKQKLMKLTIITLLIAISSIVCFAQSVSLETTIKKNEPHKMANKNGKPNDDTPEESARKRTATMVKDFRLNAKEEKRVYDANLSYAKSVESAKISLANNKDMLVKKTKEIENDLDAQYKSIFNSKTYKQYQAKKAAMKADLKKDRKAIKKAAKTIAE